MFWVEHALDDPLVRLGVGREPVLQLVAEGDPVVANIAERALLRVEQVEARSHPAAARSLRQEQDILLLKGVCARINHILLSLFGQLGLTLLRVEQVEAWRHPAAARSLRQEGYLRHLSLSLSLSLARARSLSLPRARAVCDRRRLGVYTILPLPIL